MKDTLKIIGIILVIAGAAVIVSGIPMSVVYVGPIGVTDVPEEIATRIIIGVVLFVLGLAAYFGKEGLRILAGKKR